MILEQGGARLFQDRARNLLQNLPAAIRGEEEPVHQVRVAARRLRVMLPILARAPEGSRVRRVRKQLKKIIAVGGIGRDLDICVALFDDHLMGGLEVEPEVEILRRRLVAARGRSRREMGRELLDLKPGRLRKDLRKLLEDGPEDLFVSMARYRRARDEGAARLQKAMDATGDRFHPESLHGVRKLARRMRYVAEVGAAFHDELEAAPRCFRKIQNALGQVQDAHVLALQMKSHAQAASRRGQERIAARAREIASGFRDLSRSLHQAYLLMEPAARVRQALSLLGHRQSAA